MEDDLYSYIPADLLLRSMYAPFIAEYLRYFEPQDMLIIENAALLSDPITHVRKAAQHLGGSVEDFAEENLLDENG